jgi:hypothetical protein
VQEHQNTIAPLDVAMVRKVLAMLTQRYRIAYWQPGYHRKPHQCLHCKEVFTARAIRLHRSRCESNPKNFSKTHSDTTGDSIALTPRLLRSLLRQIEQLDDGPQGAD